MSETVKKALKILVFLCIGIGLVYLSVKDITAEDWAQIKNSHPNYWWIILAMVAAFMSHWIRAVRWRMLIEPFAPMPSRRNAFFAVIIGYMANYAPLPRLGEVYRCVILNRYEKTPFTELVGTIVVERALDFLMMGIFMAAMLIFRAEKVYGVVMAKGQVYFHDKLVWLSSHTLIIVVGLLVVVASLVFVLRSNKGVTAKIKEFALGFWAGIKGVSKLKNPLLFWVYTVSIWLCYLFAGYFCFFCLPETSNLTLADGLVVLIFGAVGVIVSPGGIGAYQILVSKAMFYIYHIAKPANIALAWIIWGNQFVLVVLLGLISLLLLPILNRNEEVRADTVENT